MSLSDEFPKIEDDLLVLHPELEGWRDLARTNISEEARNEVNARAIARWTTRKNLMEAASGAIQALLNDGYPAPLEAKFSPLVLEELRGQRTTIDAALRRTAAVVVAATATVEFKEVT